MTRKSGIYVAPGRRVWPHEMRVAEVLALAGHSVEFLAEGTLPSADIRLDGVEYEIKSPKTVSANSLEHVLKRALRQSPNIVIDTARMKNLRDDKLCKFLVAQVKSRRQIKRLLIVNKRGQIIDISALAK